MGIGLLWHDSSSDRSLAEKIAQASQRYSERFVGKPNVCLVNPGDVEKDGEQVINGVIVRTSNTVLRHHYWLTNDPSVDIPCSVCHGTGADPMSDTVHWLFCTQCNGTGKVQKRG